MFRILIIIFSYSIMIIPFRSFFWFLFCIKTKLQSCNIIFTFHQFNPFPIQRNQKLKEVEGGGVNFKSNLAGLWEPPPLPIWNIPYCTIVLQEVFIFASSISYYLPPPPSDSVGLFIGPGFGGGGGMLKAGNGIAINPFNVTFRFDNHFTHWNTWN